MLGVSVSRIALLAAVGGAALLLTPAAEASTLCVGNGASCFSTIQAAVDAASDGDTVRVRAGTYAGGVEIDDVSIDLVGAGADRTVIRGGGPVLTIGTFGAPTQPTVAIRRVRITGGVTRSSPESVPFVGAEGIIATGGGIEIPPNDTFAGGATVTVTDSVISGNRVAPTQTTPIGPECPGGDPCPFAFAGGGGIHSWGTLKVVDSVVRDNQVGTASRLSTLASDADGAGILSQAGSLSLVRSAVSGNEATATGPEGRFAEGGGIFADGDSLSMRESSVTDNRAALAAALPNSVEQLAIGGGVHTGSNLQTARITDSTISGNSLRATNSVADAIAFSGGVNIANSDLDLVMRNVAVARNDVSAAALGPSGDAEADSAGGSLVGRVLDTRIVDNTVRVRSAAGDATAASGAAFTERVARRQPRERNSIQASSPNGTALAAGGALVVESELVLRGTTVKANTASASGRQGFAQGGGIFDAPLFTNGGPLTLVDSQVIHNVATGTPRITLQGGGIYIPQRRLTMVRSTVGDNVPDQICGC